MFGFLHLSFADILDVLMVALIIYLIFRWIKGSSAMNIFVAIMLLLVARVVVVALNMKMMSALLGTIIDVGVLALIVIFQPEIRSFLNRMGRGASRSNRWRALLYKLAGTKEYRMEGEAIGQIAEACSSMSHDRTGALIVIRHDDSLEDIIATGDSLDAAICSRLIMNIFFKNSPLHDGAMIIGGGRIVAARCTLPITQRQNIPASFGMRHKAAVGISEKSDADVVVVSEQTGRISFVKDGKVQEIDNINTLKLLLGQKEEEEKKEEKNEEKKD